MYVPITAKLVKHIENNTKSDLFSINNICIILQYTIKGSLAE